ncbi:hypothetical protein H257_17908 [Aphanomyces astaci]|uniref:Uncharacterized protein n=1 Tax=Aphanomyces astaci TaxID=112090 RepID=W4FER4_APHAT|nr:hypothetical protein H257_17908 [Aphanomyces astaci]ETV65379.1 hypothetical protein H257_17908 [Aphanomyces astaci]|eukprot:XP_009845174.1 hypothetical protein H257_17908 [Aphanomyces astaci]
MLFGHSAVAILRGNEATFTSLRVNGSLNVDITKFQTNSDFTFDRIMQVMANDADCLHWRMSDMKLSADAQCVGPLNEV